MARKIVIVGGVAAGASAATRARRLSEDAKITVFEKSGYPSFANCGLPYYIGGSIQDRSKLLLQSPEQFKKRFNIDVHVRHEVVAIDRAHREVEVVDLQTGARRREPYDRLILATGASPFIPPVEGIDADNVFTLRNIEDMDRVYRYLEEYSVSRVAVIGAGFIGLEGAEVLLYRGFDVDVIELADQVLPPLDGDMANRVAVHLREKGVTLHLGAAMQGLELQDGKAARVVLPDGKYVDTDMVLMSIGVRPNVSLAKEAGLELGPAGGIRVDEHLRTSDPNILAAGDAVEVVHSVTGNPLLIPLAGPANKHGRLAGEIAITDEGVPAARVAGTAIVHVFDLAVAMTGLSMKAAARLGMQAASVEIRRGHHVGYYPGSEMMDLKLVYSPETGRVLGAQIVGGAGVDRRVDVIATAIHFGASVNQLADLDLAYAPQYGAAKDPVHIAAFVADNERRGLVHHVSAQQLLDGLGFEHLLVDVRTPAEFKKGTIPGAVNIELDQLRERLSEVHNGRSVVVFCQVGQRGYNAARVLMNAGFHDVYNLAGGYHAYALVRA